MEYQNLEIIKQNGQRETFSFQKFQQSLARSGASETQIHEVVEALKPQLHTGISTREIYRMASAILKKQTPGSLARFSLKKALLDLGPSGYPFERFVAYLFQEMGFETQVGLVLDGKCVSHEIDVFGTKDKELILVECKFRNQGIHVDVKVPLYIHSRFQDLLDQGIMKKPLENFTGWIATNSRFSDDAISFARCKNIQLLSWDFPARNSIRDWIDKLGLYPLTCLSSLTQAEKRYLLEKEIVLVRELAKEPKWLGMAGVSGKRLIRTEEEISGLMGGKPQG
jgi:hypothetical protein